MENKIKIEILEMQKSYFFAENAGLEKAIELNQVKIPNSNTKKFNS